MKWNEIRKDYPNQWVVIEALKSHIIEIDSKTIDELNLIEAFNNSAEAYRCYRELHKQGPDREYLIASTNHQDLKVKLQYWTGIRARYEI